MKLPFYSNKLHDSNLPIAISDNAWRSSGEDEEPLEIGDAEEES